MVLGHIRFVKNGFNTPQLRHFGGFSTFDKILCPRRAILENRMEAPENWYEAAAASGAEAVGRYEIKGSLCVFASKQARLDNKNPIGGFDYCCCVENLDQPILSSVYAKIKSLNPQLEDDL